MYTIGILGDSFFDTKESWIDRRKALKSLLSCYCEEDEVGIAIHCNQLDISDYSRIVSSLGFKTTLMYDDFTYGNNKTKTIDRAIVFSKGGIRATHYIELLTNSGIQFDIIQLTQKEHEFKLREFFVYDECEVMRFSVSEDLHLGFKWHDMSKKYWLMDEGEMVIQSFIRDCHNGMKLNKEGDSYRIYMRSSKGCWYDFTKIAIGVIHCAWSEAHIYKELNVKTLFNALVEKLQLVSANPKRFTNGQYVILEDL